MSLPSGNAACCDVQGVIAGGARGSCSAVEGARCELKNSFPDEASGRREEMWVYGEGWQSLCVGDPSPQVWVTAAVEISRELAQPWRYLGILLPSHPTEEAFVPWLFLDQTSVPLRA
jgi:hypothetical protein